jgi:hypothetical protein
MGPPPDTHVPVDSLSFVSGQNLELLSKWLGRHTCNHPVLPGLHLPCSHVLKTVLAGWTKWEVLLGKLHGTESPWVLTVTSKVAPDR